MILYKDMYRHPWYTLFSTSTQLVWYDLAHGGGFILSWHINKSDDRFFLLYYKYLWQAQVIHTQIDKHPRIWTLNLLQFHPLFYYCRAFCNWDEIHFLTFFRYGFNFYGEKNHAMKTLWIYLKCIINLCKDNTI